MPGTGRYQLKIIKHECLVDIRWKSSNNVFLVSQRYMHVTYSLFSVYNMSVMFYWRGLFAWVSSIHMHPFLLVLPLHLNLNDFSLWEVATFYAYKYVLTYLYLPLYIYTNHCKTICISWGTGALHPSSNANAPLLLLNSFVVYGIYPTRSEWG